jgi:plastocyanin
MHVFRYLLILILINIKTTDSQSQIKGKIEVDPGKETYLANNVIYIEYVDGEYTPDDKNPVMNQQGLKFVPHVLPVLTGTTVDFLNSDDVLHNVFSPDKCADKFNLGTWSKNETRSHTYEKLGCESVILCNVHPEMEAYVVVLQNPFFTVSNSSGQFQIDDVPPGKYILKVWNERLRADDQEITVPSSGDVQVNFKLAR